MKTRGDSLLQVVHLSHTIAEKRLVDDVSFDVSRGEVIAIDGPSGAGKSSLLRLINRLDEPTSGTVLFEGRNYREVPPRELRGRIGMVMQSAFLFPGTILENLRFGPSQRGEKLPLEKAEWLLERVGLSGYGDREVGELSGGEAQRVSLARALANAPEVLLLDEPTSALDDTTKGEVEKLILGVIQEQGLNCLIVTHDSPQAARVANRVLVMDKGRLVRIDSI